nr:DUF1016 N-terminal domain-containing protein [Brevibacterium yomogidense]
MPCCRVAALAACRHVVHAAPRLAGPICLHQGSPRNGRESCSPSLLHKRSPCCQYGRSVTHNLVPDGYATTLAELKHHVDAARFQSQRKANTELLKLWWRIGRTILERQQQEAWGTGVLERLAKDLRAEFPSMKGFSVANLC